MNQVLTTLEAANKYKLSMRYLRVLLANGKIKGRQAAITLSRGIWLIDERSVTSAHTNGPALPLDWPSARWASRRSRSSRTISESVERVWSVPKGQ